MDHDHDHDSVNGHHARRQRAGAAMLGLVAVALLATACGGEPKNPGVASAGGTTTATASTRGSSGASGSTTTARPASAPGPSTSSGSTTTTTVVPSGSSGPGSSEEASQSQQLQLAQCMRSHGALNFPDPSAGGGFLNALSASGINTHSPTYQEALQACKKYTPAGAMSPAQSAADNTEALEFSQCMRSHRVPNYPEPSTGPAGEQVMDLRGKGIDLSSPTFQAANKACQKIAPGSK